MTSPAPDISLVGPFHQYLAGPSVARFDAACERIAGPLRRRAGTDRAFHALSELSDFSLIWHVVAVAQGLRGGPGAEQRMIRLVVTQGVEAALVNGPVKAMFRRQRPVLTAPRVRALRQPRTSSFPSGHASAAGCAVVLLADGASRPAQLAWLALGSSVAWSRVHVRIHHGSDVVGGALVGMVIGAMVRRIVRVR